jgi:Cu-Zn family superoxide dismutase
MHDAQGNFLGTVWFLPRGHKVAVRATTSFLPEGFHGFHIHSVGACTPPFTSAGGHYNPAGVGHGRHAGDMPVLSVGKDGVAWAEFQTDAFTIDELLDADGSAVIVHAGSDNYANIPPRYSGTGPDAATLATGDAGTRIACGAVEAR